MVERSDRFPHIQLSLAKEGIAASPQGGGRNKDPQTLANSGDRWGHGSRLNSSVSSITANWKDTEEKREEEEQPELPKSRRIILKIDPNSFDPESLKSYGIELIAEIEDGYIIGASADLELSELRNKIGKFIREEYGGAKVAEIWELIDGIKKPEYILSPELMAHWDLVKDDQIYTVDVGIACLGITPKLPNSPKRETNESDEHFEKRVNRWIDKRDFTYENWDDIKSERENEFTEFIQNYKGEILNIVDGSIHQSAKLPDSFSCRIQISGKGLKDLVFNFPYIFDVSEPDEFAEFVEREALSDVDTATFKLQAPKLNAPKVCVIDSGIQERHPLLKAAIDCDNSTSWVPGETDQIADRVRNGGHGTRVAGAVIYPITIPRTGKEKAICWIQNARVLDVNCQLPKQLFPPKLLGDIVDFYHGQTKTRIFNHSITGSVPCHTQYMSPWAAAIDNLTWKNDILFIVAAGNLPFSGKIGYTRLSVKDHLAANRLYPDYLLENSCRIANPAQSFQALTVGSISPASYHG